MTAQTIKASDLIELAKSNRENKATAEVFAPNGVGMGRPTSYKLDWARVIGEGKINVMVVRTGGYPDSFTVNADTMLQVTA